MLQTNCCILKIVLLHCLLSKLNVTIMYSLSEWSCYVIHGWVYWQLRNDSLACDLFSEKNLMQFWSATQQSYANLPMLSFHCLLPFISTYLCEQGWILGEVIEKQSPRVPLFQRCRGHPLTLSYLVLFSIITDQIYFKITKKIRSIQS